MCNSRIKRRTYKPHAGNSIFSSVKYLRCAASDAADEIARFTLLVLLGGGKKKKKTRLKNERNTPFI